MQDKALSLGFDVCKIAPPQAPEGAPARLDAWLLSGAAGDMDWMAAEQARRADPRVLWPEVESIIVVGMNYGPPDNPLAALEHKSAGGISVYARHRDYHDVLKGKLKLLASWFASAAQRDGMNGAEVKVFVDTAPVMEKPLAQAAGLGWQGKHTNLVSRELGSWLFLGSMFTNLALAPDPPEADHCGHCRACLDSCPTGAFPRPYVLDARRCISYLTIEHKGHIGAELRPLIGNRIYGCDDCLAVCPWNKFAEAAREAKLQARPELCAPPLADLLRLDDAAFRTFFAGSPIKRIGSARFLRNVLIAAGNSGESSLIEPVADKLAAASPLVRAMAVWALGRLVSPERLREWARAQRAQRAREQDGAVAAEWSLALGPGVGACLTFDATEPEDKRPS
ncbi:tRNA epoxyqueuosine(34) reductase QueG [Methylocapsa palsarum]|uniref:tRNA epoxyqueuosine(34) reductase QueG n=1 Tax=Methylocapsa palsarum TaxID=1612308 RepID=UPI003CC7A835